METLQHLPAFVIDVVRLCLWLMIIMVIFVPLENFCHLRRQKVFRKAFFTDLIYYFLNGLLPKLLLVVPISLIVRYLRDFVPYGLHLWVAGLPLGVRFAVAMVVGEIGFYWGHRWMHEIPLLWRFHAIHHSAEQIDWLVNTRAHPVDLVFTRLCGFIPMYLLGLTHAAGNQMDSLTLWVTLLSTIWGFFIHANIRWRFGWLEWFISTPGFHHWHHSNDGLEFINKNYSSMLPWVDKLFGTFYLPKHQWPMRYGIDEAISSSIVGQLLQPFKIMRAKIDRMNAGN